MKVQASWETFIRIGWMGFDLCGSVGCASSCKAKGCWFDSWSGHIPGLWLWSLNGEHRRGNQSMFLSLHFSLSSPVSKNK